ncbi:hypothetical protein T484DRAFT_3481328 [Baffinella frigidus]|nr:hypothetical protein T484DRAFT_3481328 [Cryptophyta sp. CCMP2293]
MGAFGTMSALYLRSTSIDLFSAAARRSIYLGHDLPCPPTGGKILSYPALPLEVTRALLLSPPPTVSMVPCPEIMSPPPTHIYSVPPKPLPNVCGCGYCWD